jgi:predicted Zn-dependent protease
VVETIDEQRTLYNLYSIYKYRGLLRPADGAPAPAPQFGDVAQSWSLDTVDFDTKLVYDTEVHKDVNTKRLVTNYTAAHLKLCINYLQTSRFDEAKRELERAILISPGYEGYKEIAIATYGFSGDIAKAESLAYSFIAREPKNANLYAQLFRVYRRAELLPKSEEILLRLVDQLPNDPEGYSLLASFYEEQNAPGKAADVVRRWMKLHPNDRSAAGLLQTLESKARGE